MNKKLKIILSVVSIIIVTAFILLINERNKENIVNEALIALDEESCEKQNGEWASYQSFCNLPTSDSGKECLSGSECEGSCLGEGEPNWVKPEGKNKANEPYPLAVDQASAPKIGKCSEFQNMLGCRFYMVDGKASYMCID